MTKQALLLGGLIIGLGVAGCLAYVKMKNREIEVDETEEA